MARRVTHPLTMLPSGSPPGARPGKGLSEMRIRWEEEALADLVSLRGYIAEDNPSAAEKVARRILEYVNLLLDQPLLGGPERIHNTREIVVNQTPYTIVYHPSESTITVLRVFTKPENGLNKSDRQGLGADKNQLALPGVISSASEARDRKSNGCIWCPRNSMRCNRYQKEAGFPFTLELNNTKLPQKSWAKISQTRTLSTKRLGKKIGKASGKELELVIEGLNEIITGQPGV